MTRNKTKWWILGISVAIIVAVISVFIIIHKIRTDPVKARMVNEPIPVKIATVGKKKMFHVVGTAGSAKEFTTIKIISKVEAQVKTVNVDVGDVVKKNQLLVEFGETVLNAEFTSAEARLNNANITVNNSKLNLERMKELFDQKLIAKIELEHAQQDYVIAQAEYEAASYNLTKVKNRMKYLKVKAPITGVILERKVNPGESPPLNSRLFSLGMVDDIFMVARVAEENIGNVFVGQKAEVVFDAYPNLTYKGKVYKIDANVNTELRFISTYIKLSNKDLKLKPGLTGFCRIYYKKEALAIPNLAIINPTSQRATVFVIDNENVAHLREIKTGIKTENYTEVISGLAEEEKLVAAGMRGLRDNDKVRIMEMGAEEKSYKK